jgi:SnoaL-like domain
MVWTLLAALIAFALIGDSAHAQEPPRGLEQYVEAFEAALDRQEYARAAQFLAADVSILSPTAIHGRDAVAQWLTTEFPGNTIIEVSTFLVNGQRVTWMSRVTRGARVSLTTDEAVIVDNQIALWSARVVSDTLIVPPQFRRARALDVANVRPGVKSPTLTVLNQDPRAPTWVFTVAVLASLAEGALFSVWRQRYHPRVERQSRQGGRLLLKLRERVRA